MLEVLEVGLASSIKYVLVQSCTQVFSVCALIRPCAALSRNREYFVSSLTLPAGWFVTKCGNYLRYSLGLWHKKREVHLG